MVDARRASMLAYTLPTPPSVNHYYQRTRRGVALSADARVYRDAVAALLLGAEPMAGDVSVSVVWRRRRRRGDVDNIVKPLLDALEGRLFYDDKQVVMLCVRVERAREDCVRVVVARA